MNNIYKKLVEAATEGLIYQEADGEIKIWNRMAKKLFGIGPDQALGRNSFSRDLSLINEDGTPCPDDQHPSAITLASGKPLTGQVKGIRRENGSTTWVSINTSPVFEADEKTVSAVLISCRDITADRAVQRKSGRDKSFEDIRGKKQAMEALARSEERYRLLAENSFDVIYMGDKNFRPTYFSPSVERMMGYTPEEMMELPLEQFVSPQSLGPVREYARQRYESEKRGQGDDRSRDQLMEVIRRDGERIWVELITTPIRNEDGTFQGVVGVVRESTARVLAEKSLQKSETLFRELFDNMSNGVAIYEAVDEGRDFIFKDLNRSSLEKGHKKKKEIIGRSVREVFPGVEELGLLDVFKRVWQTGRPEHHPSSVYQDDLLTIWVENYVFKLPSGEVIAVYDDTTDRHKAEEALRDSEDKFRSINEQMTETVFLTDRKGLITYMSPLAENIFGYTPGEMVNSRFTDYLADDFIGPALAAFGETLERGLPVDHLSLRMKRKDGSLFSGELTGKPYQRHGNIVGTIGVIRDITERKRAEEALRLSEEKFSKAFQRSPVWVVLSSFKEGRYLEVNDFFLESTGYTRDEVIGRTSLELNTWADPRVRSEMVDRIRAEKSIRNVEVERLNRRGEILNMLFSGEVITVGREKFLLSVSLDITERKRMEEALRSSRELFNLFAVHLPGLVYIKDHQGRYLFLNDKCSQFFGFPVEEVVGKRSQDIFDPSRATLYIETDKQVLETGRPVTLTEEISGPDGRTRIMSNYKFLIERTGQPPLIAGFYLDTTDRVRAEEALRKSEEKMRSIFRAAPIGISLAVDRTIIEVNEGFCRMTGYSKDELIGENAKLFYPSKEDYEYVGEKHFRQLSERGISIVETRYKRKDGQIINVLVRATPLDPTDHSAGVTFTALDIE